MVLVIFLAIAMFVQSQFFTNVSSGAHGLLADCSDRILQAT